jgi:hypothetical protein
MKIGDSPVSIRAPLQVPALRRVEKSSSANCLRRDGERDPAYPVSYRSRGLSMAASQIETRFAAEPERRGMHAGFVAQVLGQILGPCRGNAAVAARAYVRTSVAAGERRLIGVL